MSVFQILQSANFTISVPDTTLPFPPLTTGMIFLSAFQYLTSVIIGPKIFQGSVFECFLHFKDSIPYLQMNFIHIFHGIYNLHKKKGNCHN